MALVILVASMQVSISKMTCYVANDTFYSLGEFEDCTPINKGDLSKKCCDFDKITFDYNVNSTVFAYDINLTKIVGLSLGELVQIIKTPVLNSSFLHFFHNLPPPQSGTERLINFQVFRL
jgi:hypothetical protein